MSDPIIRNEIPVPADPELLAQYLDLGWYQLPDPPRLKWSFPRGSPRHPGDKPDQPVKRILQMLDVMLLRELERHLPMAGSVEEDATEVRVLLKVKYQKVMRRQRHKGAAPLAAWQPADADLTILP